MGGWRGEELKGCQLDVCSIKERVGSGEAYVCFPGVLPFLPFWVDRQRACCPLPLTMACTLKHLKSPESILSPLLTCFCTSQLLLFSSRPLFLSKSE